MVIFNQSVSIKTKLTSKISMRHSFCFLPFWLFCVVVLLIFLSFSCLNSTIFRSLDMSLAYECQLCLCKHSILQLTPSLPLKNKHYVHKTLVWLQSGFFPQILYLLEAWERCGDSKPCSGIHLVEVLTLIVFFLLPMDLHKTQRNVKALPSVIRKLQGKPSKPLITVFVNPGKRRHSAGR